MPAIQHLRRISNNEHKTKVKGENNGSSDWMNIDATIRGDHTVLLVTSEANLQAAIIETDPRF